MSRLFFTERGRALVRNNEEITRWRWAKKLLEAPPVAASCEADIWLFLQMYQDNREPLEVRLGGKRLAVVEPGPALAVLPTWQKVTVPAGRLTSGVNEIELRCDAPAMNAWMVGIEDGHCHPDSFLSTDRGRTWCNRDMGVHGTMQGEYLIRVRSHSEELNEPDPPRIIYEDPSNARVQELAGLVPESIRTIHDPWRRLLALRSWVSWAWPYRSSGRVYTPWDPWTILDWGKANRGHGCDGTIAMCVHYATLFASLASALGHSARSVVVTEKIDTPAGHFLAEVWDARLERWVLHDPNFDLHFEDGPALSAMDIADRNHRGESLQGCAVTGEDRPTVPEHLVDWFDDVLLSGRCLRCTGIWASNQYVSNPAVAPPSHGAVSYCETDIVWYNPVGLDLAPMFPYRTAKREYFDRKPQEHFQTRKTHNERQEIA